MCNQTLTSTHFHFCQKNEGFVCCGYVYSPGYRGSHCGVHTHFNKNGKRLTKHKCTDPIRKSFFAAKCENDINCSKVGFHQCDKVYVCHGKKMLKPSKGGNGFSCEICNNFVIPCLKCKLPVNDFTGASIHEACSYSEKEKKSREDEIRGKNKTKIIYSNRQKRKCLKATRPKVPSDKTICPSETCILKGCHFCDDCEGIVCCGEIFSCEDSGCLAPMPGDYTNSQSVSLRDHKCEDTFCSTFFEAECKTCYCDGETDGTHWCTIFEPDYQVDAYFCHGQKMKTFSGKFRCQNKQCNFVVSICEDCGHGISPFQYNHPTLCSDCNEIRIDRAMDDCF